MAVNYGIGFCEKVLADLATIEEEMFKIKGHGFDYFGQEFATEKKYRRLLKQFKSEKESGIKPSYDPNIHGFNSGSDK